MRGDFHVIIPARYQSSRLPGKLLMELQGVSVIQHVYQQALKAEPKSITIATDSELIAEHAQQFGAQVQMTASTHQSGTDRIAEVVSKGDFSKDALIVNVQGDEPLIAPALIKQVAQSLALSSAPMATLCWPLSSQAQFENPNVVKVVRNCHNQALYFSRAPIPAHRDHPNSLDLSYRHIGLYAYRADFLLKMVDWPMAELEGYEALEQLRVLWQGYPIQVDQACVEPLQDINTAEDLEQARDQLKSVFEALNR